MGLNEIGNIAATFWHEIPEHFPFVRLHESVVMPNHMHGVLEIWKPDNGLGKFGNSDGVTVGHSVVVVGVQNFEPLPPPPNVRVRNEYQHIIPKSLSSIIRAYKSAVTMWCNRNDHSYFQWQRLFYDHIIRNDKSFHRIQKYIHDNPIKWQMDVENKTNQLSEKQIKRHYDDLFDKN